MNARFVVASLAVLTLIFALGAGVFYVLNLDKHAVTMLQAESRQTLSKLNEQITLYMDRDIKTGQLIASLGQLEEALQKAGDPEALEQANKVLDHTCTVLKGYTCYMMDATGLTIAASNRATPGSFVGKNYAFRPYFKQALNGEPSTYLALGVTSNKRGIYSANPVKSSTGENLGVVVLKANIEEFEALFVNLSGASAFIDNNGLVFASNRSDWLFKTIWKRGKDALLLTPDGNQFGMTKHPSLNFTRTEDGWVKDLYGKEYLMETREIESLPGWSLFYLKKQTDLGSHFLKELGPLGNAYVLLLFLVSLMVYYLYRTAKGDLDRRVVAEEKLWHMANHDNLTKLPTVQLGKDRISAAMAMARRNKTMAAIMFIDLDGFKAINDNLGHETGDKVLIEVSARLSSCVREVDTMARIGGDEFMIVLSNIHNRAGASKVAKSLINAMSQPFRLDDQDTSIGLSIGIALYPEHGEEPETILKRADEAMYEVKASGKNNYKFAGN